MGKFHNFYWKAFKKCTECMIFIITIYTIYKIIVINWFFTDDTSLYLAISFRIKLFIYSSIFTFVYVFIYQFKFLTFIIIGVVNNQINILEMAHQIKLIKINLSLSYFYSNFNFLSSTYIRIFLNCFIKVFIIRIISESILFINLFNFLNDFSTNNYLIYFQFIFF